MPSPFNEIRAIRQANQLALSSNELDVIKTQLDSYRSLINQSWQGSETASFNSSVDELLRELSRLSTQLEQVAADIKIAARTTALEQAANGA